MHTSSILKATDFRYRWSDSGEPADFGAFCPDYHENDRLAVVCTCLEDGVLHTGYGLLAVATAFYDVLRERGGEFFDYPRHFAFVDVDEKGVSTRGERVNLDHAALAAPWSNLDVWPESQCIEAPGTAAEMLRKVFEFQINRVFWPEGLAPGTDEAGDEPLPDYARQLLDSRLKSVHYYASTASTLEIHAGPPAVDLVRGSLHCPNHGKDQPTALENNFVGYRQVTVDGFLKEMDSCFTV